MPTSCPIAFLDVSGEVRIDADRVIHFKNLEGRVGESKVTCPRGKLWNDEQSHLAGHRAFC